jgi:hypothetical protein
LDLLAFIFANRAFSTGYGRKNKKIFLLPAHLSGCAKRLKQHGALPFRQRKAEAGGFGHRKYIAYLSASGKKNSPRCR